MAKKTFLRRRYVTPRTEVMELESGNILTVSASPGGWSVDDGTSASKSGWSSEDYFTDDE